MESMSKNEPPSLESVLSIRCRYRGRNAVGRWLLQLWQRYQILRAKRAWRSVCRRHVVVLR